MTSLIFKRVSEALENLPNVMPFKVKKPVKLEFRVKKDYYLAVMGEEIKKIKIDGRNVVIDASDYFEACNVFWDCYLKMMFSK